MYNKVEQILKKETPMDSILSQIKALVKDNIKTYLSDVINDEDAIDAFFELSRTEGIIPAIESSHAVAYAMKLAKTMGKGSILICLSGRGDKYMDYIIEKYGIR